MQAAMKPTIQSDKPARLRPSSESVPLQSAAPSPVKLWEGDSPSEVATGVVSGVTTEWFTVEFDKEIIEADFPEPRAVSDMIAAQRRFIERARSKGPFVDVPLPPDN